MPRRIRNPWPARRRSAVESAERLVTTTANSLPVNLKDIAEHRGVQRIEFTQLLTEGGLAVQDNGFIIYVRCDPGQGADFTARFAEDGTGSTLPKTIVGRTRFTIAHEIAHTFFYDMRSMPPRPKAQIEDASSAMKLELICNEIAGLLVLPETLIHRYFTSSEFVRPEDLRKLANKAMVSPQTVIHRFKQLRKLSHPEAILVAVTREETDWKITAISSHYSLRNIFAQAKIGASLKMLVDEPDFILFGGEMREVDVGYVGHGGKSVKMQFACEIGVDSHRVRSVFVVGVPLREEIATLVGFGLRTDKRAASGL